MKDKPHVHKFSVPPAPQEAGATFSVEVAMWDNHNVTKTVMIVQQMAEKRFLKRPWQIIDKSSK